MKTKKYTTNRLLLAAGVLITSLLILTACTPDQTTADESPTQESHEVHIPVVGSESADKGDNADVDEAYPGTEQDSQAPMAADLEAADSYPAPEEQEAEQPAAKEPAPAETVKPTPRGDDLVATNPAEVSLASGSLQLVEMFAFW